MDRNEKPEDRLGPAETLLVEAAELAVRWHGSTERDQALITQAREKVPDPELGTGGELIQNTHASSYLLNTLNFPDFIAADASSQRMALAQKAGAIAIGVDTADTIQASNSVERMLAHQLAATHVGVMRMLGQLNCMFHEDSIAKNDSANLRATRIAGTASRLMNAFQQGMVTLDRIRTGGKQTIIVQHVNVNEGGQAVVSGKMKAPSRGGRGVRASVVSPEAKQPQRKPRRGPEGGK